VHSVEDAPQGGKTIKIGDDDVWVSPEHSVTVKPGDVVDAGDDLTDGIPHPRDLVRYRGIGEARRVLLGHLRDAVSNTVGDVHRRNLESVVTGLINHVVITDPDGYGDHIVDDKVQSNRVFATYRPREGFQRVAVPKAVGRYLEEPALHYTPGTRITSKVADELKSFGIKDLDVHDDPPGFEPEFERLATVSTRDVDPVTRMGGFYIGKGLLESVHRGGTTDPRGTSFYPAYAKGTDFGKTLKDTGKY
jgi:hypothetical protein